MFSNRSSHDRRVATALVPLYTRMMKETVRLTDYLQTVEGASSAQHSDSESAQFANLYLRKMLSELESPVDFLQYGGRRRMDLRPRRKQPKTIVKQVAASLQILFQRVSIDDLDGQYAGSKFSRLYNSISYYRLALQILANLLEAEDKAAKRSSSSRTIHNRLLQMRNISKRLVALSPMVIDQFNEKAYLLANMDVRAAVAANDISCGLEHFAVQGAVEAKSGGRSAPGVDLDLIQNDEPSEKTAEQLREVMAFLDTTMLFDADWYQKKYGQCAQPLLEYCQSGYLDGRLPNRVFNQDWYCETYSDVHMDEEIPLYHYARIGEAEGRQPAESFDPAWYRQQYKLADDKEFALAHYLHEGRAKKNNPNPYFDVDYYLKKNIDVAKAGVDPVEHFYTHGWLEKRNPSAAFKVEQYAKKHLDGTSDINPVTHALQKRLKTATETGLICIDEKPSMTDKELPVLSDIAGNIKYFANAGPGFEQASTIDCSALKTKAKTIAFYLPQFHTFEENDRWWGKGFSEWRNVTRGTPRYAGHYQPRIPRDLGFYDLNDVSVLEEQASMALRNGIEAFCFYYYWFNGKRLMDKPLDSFANADIEQEFCIMWANENWTRTWDGFDSEILIQQDYRDHDEDDFIADTLRYFEHERYVRVEGRPLFILYRPGLLPNARETFKRWRSKWAEALGVEPWILMVQGFDSEDPGEFGLDGAVEFPPHKICKNMPDIQDELTILDPAYSGNARAYEDVIARSLGEQAPDYPLIKTVVPHWDNDARREGRGFNMHGSTPELYEYWLRGVISHAEKNPFKGEPIVFINAWNEWAESAYLEPDVHYGHAYLNATKRATHGLTSTRSRQKILLVGHDAYRHGAQMLLLSIARTCHHQFGLEVVILLKQSGPLLADYQAIGRTIVLDQLGEDNLDGWLRHEGLDMAICNTSVTGDVVPVLRKAGLRVVSLIHELPNLIAEYKLGGNIQLIADQANHVIFPSEIVQSGFSEFVSDIGARQIIRPQGTYKQIDFDEVARREIRRELGIAVDEKMVLNVGFADLRKGFDIFMQLARQLVQDRPDVHFVWVGDMSPDMKRWVKSDVVDSIYAKHIHLIGFSDRMADYYSACDCLFVSSREDPYPTVVLEAMSVGVPVVLFKGATGFDSLMATHGFSVDRSEHSQLAKALVQSLFNDSRAAKQKRSEYVDTYCRFDDYCFDLLQMLQPELKKVSVVIPNYNYESYMASRLGSVFDQTYPVFETIVLDDCSSDNSVEIIEQFAKDASRIVSLIPNKSNSGNVFRQWNKGVNLCRGDYVWIAEADDLSDPLFISESLAAFDESTALSFTDSIQIGSDNELLAQSYNYYYRQVDEDLFSTDFRLNGPDFVKRVMSVRNVIMNVSSVIWRSEVLATALNEIGDELPDYKLVGDWRLYLEVLMCNKNSIAYLTSPLNTHRRHQKSVTHSLDHAAHLSEIQAMHLLVSELMPADTDMQDEMQAYINELRKQFKLAPVAQEKAA